jgi:hypothetical protein
MEVNKEFEQNVELTNLTILLHEFIVPPVCY